MHPPFLLRISALLFALHLLTNGCSTAEPDHLNNHTDQEIGFQDTGFLDVSEQLDTDSSDTDSSDTDSSDTDPQTDTDPPTDVDPQTDVDPPTDADPQTDVDPPTDADHSEYPNFGSLKDDALLQAIRAAHTHQSVGYSAARTIMFGTLDNVNGQTECIYTGTKYTTDGGSGHDHNIINTEHTWPQSRGASSEPQRSDLHHLYPATATSNSRRGNHEFGVVVNATWSERGSKLGKGVDGETRFEPRDVSKGKVARAILYFSAIYDEPIRDVEEATLRQWHAQYPVTDEDRARNDLVQEAQRSRNPFIDNPDLVSRIADF